MAEEQKGTYNSNLKNKNFRSDSISQTSPLKPNQKFGLNEAQYNHLQKLKNVNSTHIIQKEMNAVTSLMDEHDQIYNSYSEKCDILNKKAIQQKLQEDFNFYKPKQEECLLKNTKHPYDFYYIRYKKTPLDQINVSQRSTFTAKSKIDTSTMQQYTQKINKELLSAFKEPENDDEIPEQLSEYDYNAENNIQDDIKKQILSRLSQSQDMKKYSMIAPKKGAVGFFKKKEEMFRNDKYQKIRELRFEADQYYRKQKDIRTKPVFNAYYQSLALSKAVKRNMAQSVANSSLLDTQKPTNYRSSQSTRTFFSGNSSTRQSNSLDKQLNRYRSAAQLLNSK